MKYIGPATSSAAGCFQWVSGPNADSFDTYQANQIRMAPLCWVEGKPVYKGDKLYIKDINLIDTVTGSNDFEITFQNSGACYKDNRNGNLTWTPRKVKKTGWINIYPEGHISPLYHKTEETAKIVARDTVVATIKIEWEE